METLIYYKLIFLLIESFIKKGKNIMIMRNEEILSELKKINKIKDLEKKSNELKSFIEKLERAKIKIVPSGNYVYFYPYTTEYDPETKKTKYITGITLGKLSKDKYEIIQKRIDDMSLDELKKLIEVESKND